MQNIPSINKPQLREVTGLPSISIPKVGERPYRRTPYIPRPYSTAPNLVFDYNDPNQINSFADVFYRFVEKLVVDKQVKESITGLGSDLGTLYKGAVAPLTQNGNWQGFGMNLLNNAMETVDLLANPVKGAILYDDSNWSWEGFRQGSFGRRNYDFNTGNVGGDILREIAVDPTTWLSLGASGLIKGGLKNASKQIAKEMGQEVTQKQIRNMLIRGIRKEGTEKYLAKFSKNILESSLPNASKARIGNIMLHDINLNVIKTANTMTKTADVIDKTLINSALLFTPTIIKLIGVNAARYVANVFNNKLQKHVPEGAEQSLVTYLRALTELENEYDNLKAILDEGLKGDVVNHIGHNLAIKDYTAIRTIIGSSANDVDKFLKAMDVFAKKSGAASFEEYRIVIQELQQTTTVKGPLRNLSELVNDVGKIYQANQKYITETTTRIDAFEKAIVDAHTRMFDTGSVLDKNATSMTDRFDIFPSYAELELVIKDMISHVQDLPNELKLNIVEEFKFTQRLGKILKEIPEASFDEMAIIDLVYDLDDIVKNLLDYTQNINPASIAPELKQLGMNKTFEKILTQTVTPAKEIFDKFVQDGVFKVYDSVIDGAKHLDNKETYDAMISFLNDIDDYLKKVETYEIADTSLAIEHGNFEILMAKISEGSYTSKEYAEYLDSIQGIQNSLDMHIKYHDSITGVTKTKVKVKDKVGYHLEEVVTKTHNEVLTNLIKMRDNLEHFKHTEYVQDIINIDSETRRYIIKRSQIDTNLNLYATEGLEELVEHVENFDEFARLFNQILVMDGVEPTIKAYASDVLSILSGIGKTRDFYTKILTEEMFDDNIKFAFLDTLQTFAKRDLADFKGEQLGAYQYLINRGIQNNITGNTRQLRYSLESYIAREGKAINEFIAERYPDILKKGSHDADYDIAVTEYLVDKLGMNKNSIIVDIETTGLGKSDGDHIIQIAYKLPDGTRVVRTALPPEGIVPTESVMRKLLGDRAEGVANEDLYSLFRDVFQSKYSEANLLKGFLDDVNLVYKADPTTSLIGHNIKDFDERFISRRLRMNKMNALPDIYIEDTLETALAKDGIQIVTKDQQDRIAEMVNDYIEDRYNELTYNLYIENRLTGILNSDTLPRSFIESPNGEFASKLRDVANAIDDVTKGKKLNRLVDNKGMLKEIADDTIKNTYSMYDFADKLKVLSANLYATLGDIKGFNKGAGMYYIDADEIYKMFPELIELKLTMAPKAFQELLDGLNINITSGLNKINVKDGKIVGLQSLASKISFDTEFIKDFFPSIKGNFTRRDMERLHTAARHIQYNYNSVVNVSALTAKNVSDLETIFNALKKTLNDNTKKRIGFDLIELKELNFNKQNSRMAFAQTVYLYKRMAMLMNDKTLLEQSLNTLVDNATIVDLLKNPKDLKDSLVAFGSVDFDSYFRMNHYSEFEELIHEFNMDDNAITSVDNLLKKLDKHNINTAKMFSATSTLKQIQTAFGDLVNSLKKGAKESDDAYLNRVAKVKSTLDKYKDLNALEIAKNVMHMTPEDLKGHLWNNALGTIILDSKEVSRYKIINNELFRPNNAYNKAGIKTYQTENKLIIYLDKTFSDFDIKAPTIEHVNLQYGSEHKYVKNLMVSEELLLSKVPQAKGTSFEFITRDVYKDIIDKLPDEVRADIIPLDVLDTHYRFLRTNFNHSILGTTNIKREYIPKLYNNPYKNVYASSQHYVTTADAQTRFMNMMFDESIRLDAMYNTFSNEDIVQTLRENPALRLAALVKDKKIGARIQMLPSKSLKDIENAKRLGAIVVPQQFAYKAAQVINDAKITNGFVQAFNKYIVGATKTGQLTSLGFLMRNLFDSTSKNVISAGHLDILRHMAETAKYYNEYNTVIQNIVQDTTLQHINPKTISAYFRKNPDTKITEELFNLYHEFINDGASAGRTKVLQDELGNIYKELHKQSYYPEELNVDMIRDFIEKDYMKDPSKYTPSQFRELTRLNVEYDIYAKAYAMNQKTRVNGLNTQTIAEYLKRPERIPAHLKQEFNRLMKYKPAGQMHKQIDRMIFENPLSKAVMSTNSYMEQIFRLSNFTYHVKNSGMSIHEAMAEVIRVHFDNASKSYSQVVLEMLMPFSTFSFRNLNFWANTIDHAPATFRYARDIMAPVMNLEEYTPWDKENRRSLQYQILSGNVIVNKETGLTVKLSPSMMDAYQYLYDPVNTLKGRFVPIVTTPLEMMFLEKEDWMDQEYFDSMRKRVMIGQIPLVGPLLSRAEKFGDVGIPSVFNKTNLPKPYVPKDYSRTFKKKFYPRHYYQQYKPRTYPKKYYSSVYRYRPSGYVTPAYKPIAYNTARFTAIRDMPGKALTDRRVQQMLRRRNKDSYTAKGKNKLELMMLPNMGDNAKYLLANIWS